MAQQSVAREPSMEEILASIRRIIESNEPVASDPLSAPLPPIYDGDDEDTETSFAAELVSPPAHVPPAANQGYGARQQAEAPAVTQNTDRAEAQASEKTMSLADVAARVRAAADRNAALGPQAYAANRLVEQPAVSRPVVHQERPVAAQRPVDMRPLLNAVPPVAERQVPDFSQILSRPPEPKPAPVPVPVWENLELRGAVEPEQPLSPSAPHVPDIQPEPPVAQPPVMNTPAPEKPVEETGLSLNLVSEAAGAQIARSLGQLSDIFDGEERPSVEQMAQDMLRPMLQEWLEDNLPTLVERLVREEIERVARGPRR